MELDPRCIIDEHARRSARQQPLDEHFRRAAEILAAAGEPGRIRLLLVLARGPAFVSDLAERLHARPAHVSQQLAVLREASLVRAKRRGKKVEYALADQHVRTLVELAVAVVGGSK
jgi:DNA-binding transcriptional ArsR family regulator